MIDEQIKTSNLKKKIGYCALAGVGAATIGELVAGVYEGYTGTSAEVPIVFFGPLTGYVAQLTAGATLLKSDDEMQKTIAAPVVPLLSVALYAIGHNVGYLLK